MTTLSIHDAAAEAGDRVGLVDGTTSYTFTDLARLTTEMTASRTMTAHPCADTVVSIYAALDARRSLALTHPRLTIAERNRLPRPGDGAGLVVYTSGTTGDPKPVRLTPDMLVASAEASAAHLGWRDDDRWLCPLPLAHVGGLSVITRCLIARRTAVLRDVNALDGITLASVVPAQLVPMIERDPPPSLRAVLVGGAAASPSLMARARDRGYPVLATYGMTEASSQIATERSPGDGLVPLPGMELRFEGERIFVRGPAVAGGDWLDTGDLGALDERGRLVVYGRADDVIITGGENVHPLEVERALLALPGVVEACVVGAPDDRYGAIVTAVIAGTAAPDGVRDQLGATLARFKIPRRIVVVDALPRTPSGKIDRAAIRRQCG